MCKCSLYANANANVNANVNVNVIPQRPQRASRGIPDRPWRVKGHTSEASALNATPKCLRRK